MKCPSFEELLQLELGELTVNRVRDVEHHMQECAVCAVQRRSHQGILADLGSSAPRAMTDGEFVRQTLERCEQPLAQPMPSSRRAYRWLVGSSTVAAVAALWLWVPFGGHPQGHWVARGSKDQALEPAAVEVLRVRANELAQIKGLTFRAGDGIALRFSNTGQAPRYLMAFVIDQRNDIHWIYPAYLDSAANPSSVRLESNTVGRVLDEAVEPDSPAAGPMRIVTLCTPEALTVKEVEARLKGNPHDVGALFPGAQAKEWVSEWTTE